MIIHLLTKPGSILFWKKFPLTVPYETTENLWLFTAIPFASRRILQYPTSVWPRTQRRNNGGKDFHLGNKWTVERWNQRPGGGTPQWWAGWSPGDAFCKTYMAIFYIYVRFLGCICLYDSSYCWCFRNPKANHLKMVLKQTVVNNGDKLPTSTSFSW